MEDIWSVYLIRCSDGSLYTGITNNVEKRFKAHAAGKGSKYVKARRPLKLVFSQEVGNRAEASKIEYAVKQLNKAQKEKIVARDLELHPLTKNGSDAA